MRLFALVTACLLAGPAAAQEPEWRAAIEYDVLLQAFDIEPETIRLRAGVPVRLRFVNQGQATFSFEADGFFRSARVRSGDGGDLGDGHFRLAPGERRTIALVPAPGRYRARSGNIIHRILGMTATIVVE